MGWMRFLMLAGGVVAACHQATAAEARDALGVHGAWAAFSDDKPRRCFAISEPDRENSPADPQWRHNFSSSPRPDKTIHNPEPFRLPSHRRPRSRVRRGGQAWVSTGSKRG